ncbi:MAG: hypothetical protein C4320_03210 [Armatimonadota bacterium]
MSKLDLIAPDSPEAALSRRSLVQAIGGTALAMTILAGCGGSNNDSNSGSGGTQGRSDALDDDILTFALNLEYLEAEFYSFATRGSGIAANGIGITGVGNSGPTTGGVKTNFTSTYGAKIAAEITDDETTHVTVLRGALSDKVIAKPAINLNPFGSNLDLSTENGFLNLARAFEDVGVTAYRGAAPAILKASYLGTAASILGVEALHTGNVRLQCVEQGLFGSPTGAPLDGKDQLPTASNFFSTDQNSLAFARTPREVLRIVLNQPNAATPVNAGGFFPNGVNGNLTRLLALG